MIRKLLAAVAALSLCSAAAAAGKPRTVAIVTPYMANETTKYVIGKLEEDCQRRGWKVNVTDTAGDFGLLVGRIRDAVAQKVDAIVLGMGDPAQMTAGLDAAEKAKIPVFGLDAGLARGVLLNVTSDNAALGQASARALADALGGKGKVVMFTHDPHPGVRERAAAAAAYFATLPGIQVVEKKHIEVPGPLDFARKLTQDILVANPGKGSIAGVWAGWDEPAMGAVQAAIAAGRTELKVVGIDGTPFARAEIAKKGPFLASVAQDFDAMAAKVAELIEGTLEGRKPAEQLYKLPGKLVVQ